MKNPIASLIIPSYNVEKYILETLSSVASQIVSDHSLFEVVIVDDGSTDSTPSLIRQVMQNFPFEIKFVSRSENKGAAFTRNQAIELARGKYVLLLDADDILERNALEATLDFMLKHPEIHYSYSSICIVDAKGGNPINKPGVEFSREKALHFNPVMAITCFTKEIHDLIGGYDEGMACEDYDHVLRASEILDDSAFGHNPLYLYRYRIHGSNRSVSSRKTEKKSAAEAIQASLKRKEGLNLEVYYSHRTDHEGRGFSYYEWREKSEVISNTQRSN